MFNDHDYIGNLVFSSVLKTKFDRLYTILQKNSMVHDLAWRKCSSFSLYPQMKKPVGMLGTSYIQ